MTTSPLKLDYLLLLFKCFDNFKGEKEIVMGKVSESQYLGCLLGGAIGDALGAPIEFMNLAQIRHKYGALGVEDYVEFEDGSGQFTDDTQMTLFTTEALLRAYHRAMLRGIEGALPQIAHESYLRWLYTQDHDTFSDSYNNTGWLIKEAGLYVRRAPGNTCLGALRSDKVGTIEKSINNSKGCGTIMRMAPVGLFYFGENEKAFKIACELSAITHGHPTGYLSGGVFASIIADLAVGIDLKESIDNSVRILKKWNNHGETLNAIEAALHLHEETLNDSFKVSAETLERLGQGWIAEEALSLSIFASLLFEKDFKRGVLFAVNHGGDCDSTGSIVGNILGLINGIESVPVKWIDNLRNHEIVSEIAKDLHIKVKGDHIHSDKEWWKKYPGG